MGGFISDFDRLAARGDLPPIVSIAPDYQHIVDPELHPPTFPPERFELPGGQRRPILLTAGQLVELVPLAQGLTAEQRAAELRVLGEEATKGTIDNRRKNLIDNMRVENGAHAVDRGYRLGIIVCRSLSREEWPIEPLTDRQFEELRWAALGRTAQWSADTRGVSYDSAKGSRNDVIRKLGAVNMPQAITIAHARGLLPTRRR